MRAFTTCAYRIREAAVGPLFLMAFGLVLVISTCDVVLAEEELTAACVIAPVMLLAPDV